MRTPADCGFSPVSPSTAREAGAIWVGLALVLEVAARGGEHRDVQTLDGDLFARRNHLVRSPGDGFLVRARVFAAGVDARPVVEESSHRQPLQQVRNAAHMILVEMRDQQRVDFFDAGCFRRRRDANGVASAVARITGVDEQGLTGGRNHQRGLASFDIDEVNIERLCALGGHGQRRK